MSKLKDTLDLTFLKLKVAPSHNDADYFKVFFLSGYEFSLEEIEQLKHQITKFEARYTCFTCLHGKSCKFAFDEHNTNGVCLAENKEQQND